jgi:hypothetical protein
MELEYNINRSFIKNKLSYYYLNYLYIRPNSVEELPFIQLPIVGIQNPTDKHNFFEIYGQTDAICIILNLL